MGNAASVAQREKRASVFERTNSKKRINFCWRFLTAPDIIEEDIIEWITSHPQRAKCLFHEYLVQELRNDTELNIEDLDEIPLAGKPAVETGTTHIPESRKTNSTKEKNASSPTVPVPSTSPRLPHGRNSPTLQSSDEEQQQEESWPSSLNASISKQSQDYFFFETYLSAERAKLHDQDTNAVLLDIAKDIYEELDTSILFIKILQNVGRLVSADRCSLFLVDEERNELCSKVGTSSRRLTCKVFRKVESEDASVNGSFYRNMKKEDEVRVPIGRGIAGNVAKTGQTLNIRDAYSDSRFNPDVDKDTGYTTKTILCLPIRAFTKVFLPSYSRDTSENNWCC